MSGPRVSAVRGGEVEGATIEVVYARPDAQFSSLIPAAGPLSIAEAIARSGVVSAFPEIDLSLNKVGIFGEIRALSEMACPGERVEIYRALLADPKEARKRRAARQRAAPGARRTERRRQP